MRFETPEQLKLDISEYTILLLLPYLNVECGGKEPSRVHLSAVSQLLYRRPKNGWQWHWSFVLRVFGLGFGIAHQHCESKNKAMWEKTGCKK